MLLIVLLMSWVALLHPGTLVFSLVGFGVLLYFKAWLYALGVALGLALMGYLSRRRRGS